jgi:hypothetical protein
MIQCHGILLFAIALIVLTSLLAIGNAAQPNSKKVPAKSIRITSPKDTNGQKPTSPPMRPSTAIDPLSHVCISPSLFGYGSFQATYDSLWGPADNVNSTF